MPSHRLVKPVALEVSLLAVTLFSFALFVQQVVDGAPGSGSSAIGEIPPFVAEGTLRRADSFSASHFTFQYSNGWWQVELTNPDAANGGPVVQNCMKIPDGIRYYVLFKNSDGLPTATACPSAFPPPGISGGMFECWLGLCPYSELPLIDGRSLHRFLNIPTCEPALLYADPRSRGDYHLKYLPPQGAFLSSLTVTNNGFWVDLTPKSNFAFVPHNPPFEKGGFPELTYEALQTTNVHGIAFPARAIFTRFSPAYSSKTRRDALNAHVLELAVTEVRFLGGKADGRKSPPPVMFAMDYRPSDYTYSGNSVKYLGTTVTNDQWEVVLPQNRTLRVFPSAEKLGPEWSRQLGFLFDPVSSSAEEAPRSEAFPESVVQRIRSAVLTNWEGPVISWGQARFHVRIGGTNHLYEVQVQTYNSRTRLRTDFAVLMESVQAENIERRPVQGLGEAAMLFSSSDRQKMTLWFFHREHLVSISPLGPGPHPSWEGDPSLQALANAIAVSRFPTNTIRSLR